MNTNYIDFEGEKEYFKDVTITNDTNYKNGILFFTKIKIEENVKLNFYNCIILGTLNLTNCHETSSVSFTNCIVNDRNDFRIAGVFLFGKFKSLNFKNCYINRLESSGEIELDVLRIENCVFKSINFVNYEVKSYIRRIIFIEDKLDLHKEYSIVRDFVDFDFSSNSINGIDFVKSLMDERIENLNSKVKISISFSTTFIHKLQKNRFIAFSFDNQYDLEIDRRNIIVDDSNIKHLYLIGSFHNVKIDKTKFGVLFFQDFKTNETRVYQIVSLNYKDKKSLVNFTDSLFDNVSFYNFEFKSFDEVNNYRSILENAKYIGCSYSKEINCKYYFKEFQKDIYINNNINAEESTSLKYDTYRQLASNFQKSGDIINHLRMKSNQMVAAMQKKETDCFEKKLLCINKYSNDFGNNALFAFGWIIVFSLFFTIILLTSMDYKLSLTYEGINIFFVFLFSKVLNIVSSINPNEKNGCTHLWHYLSKIIIGFLYYQFIAAYRRFGKTS